MNLPNRITLSRLALSMVLFVFLVLGQNGTLSLVGTYGWWAFGLYVLTASTDWLDGMIARRTGQVTVLGRILDPFCDKVLTSGAFILLSSGWPELLAPWFTVVVVGREFFVSAIRNVVEARGIAFGAAAPGKLKMVLQAILIGAILVVLASGPASADGALGTVVVVLFWATLLSTIQSGAWYALEARRLLAEADAA